MKKLLCLLLGISLVFGYVTPVMATETITIVDENGNGEDKKEEAKEEEQSAPAILEVTKQSVFVALGSDLNATQKATVLSLMGLTEEKLKDCNVVYVTNAEEHQYLGSYVDSSLIGKRSLSSVLVRPQSTGHGVTVKTQNINYCTDTMYLNALVTAGVTDADVLVVGPSPISGTAALIGALRHTHRCPESLWMKRHLIQHLMSW